MTTLRPVRFTSDVAAARAFFESQGLAARIASASGGWVELVAGDGSLALHDAASSSTRQPAGRTTLSAESPDVDALAEHLRSAGFEPVVYDEGYGRVLAVIDPDGGLVEVDERQEDLHGYVALDAVPDPHVRVRAELTTPDPARYQHFLGALGLAGSVELVEGPPPDARAVAPDGTTTRPAVVRLLLVGPEPGVVTDPDGVRLERRTVRVEPLDLLAHAEAARAVQVAALDTVVAVTGLGGADGEAFFDRHAARPGFRAVGAWDGPRLVGFAYGMDPAEGSWWDGWVRPAMTAAGHADLLGTSFEVVELHVEPGWHGHGLGRRLLSALLAQAHQPRALLTTQGGANPARGFYRHLGWRELAATELDGVPYLVLAIDLPAQLA